MRFGCYLALEEEVDRLYIAEKIKAGSDLLDAYLNDFPASLHRSTWYSAVLHAILKEKEPCFQMFEYGVECGFFYNLEINLFDLIRDHERYPALEKTNSQIRAAAQAKSRMEYEVLLPGGYTPEKRYPLLLALHGDGDYWEQFKSEWDPVPILERGFVVAYVRSSQVSSTGSYRWMSNYKLAREEVQACYQQVADTYPIDPTQVVAFGFSGGASAVVYLALNSELPLRGIIALGPQVPDDFTLENTRRAALRGQRSVLLRGEKEDPAAYDEILAMLEKAGYPYQSVINEGIGHIIPKDMPEKLLEALDFILA